MATIYMVFDGSGPGERETLGEFSTFKEAADFCETDEFRGLCESFITKHNGLETFELEIHDEEGVCVPDHMGHWVLVDDKFNELQDFLRKLTQ